MIALGLVPPHVQAFLSPLCLSSLFVYILHLQLLYSVRRRPRDSFSAMDTKSEQLSIEMDTHHLIKKTWRKSQFEEISSSDYDNVVQYQAEESTVSEAEGGWVSIFWNFSIWANYVITTEMQPLFR